MVDSILSSGSNSENGFMHFNCDADVRLRSTRQQELIEPIDLERSVDSRMFTRGRLMRNRPDHDSDSPPTSCSSISNLSTASFQLSSYELPEQNGRRSSFSDLSYNCKPSTIEIKPQTLFLKHSSMSTSDLYTNYKRQSNAQVICFCWIQK